MLGHLALFLLILARSVSSTCTPVLPGVFTNFQTASGSCIRFANSVFSQCRHTGSLEKVYGGAICYNQSSGEFELSSCTFFECSTYVSMFGDFGGCAYLKTSRIEIEHCCGRYCCSEVGQAFCFVVCASPNVNFSTFVNCSTSGDGDADYGALSYDHQTSAAISLLLLNVNFSGCYSCEEGSSISLTGGSSGCGTYRFISVNGATSVTSIDLYGSGTTTIEYSTFFDNSDWYGTIYANSGLISLDHCYFKNNELALDSWDGEFCAFSCFFSSKLPSVSWSSQSGNVVNYGGTVLPICHLDTAVCPAALFCSSPPGAPSTPFLDSQLVFPSASLPSSILF
jgi:hypothetical protein